MAKLVKLLAAGLVFVVGLAVDLPASLEAGSFSFSVAAACESTNIDCIPKPAPGVNFKSGGHGSDSERFPVLVCHSWWDKLWGNPAKRERWWGPTKQFRRTGWKADLAAVYQQCKVFWLLEGEEVTTEVSCLNGALTSTGPVNRTMRFDPKRRNAVWLSQ